MGAERPGKFHQLREPLAAELRAVLSEKGATEPVQVDTSIGQLSRMEAIQS